MSALPQAGRAAERKFKNKTRLVLFGSIVLGIGLTALVGVTMRAPLVGFLVGVFAAGLVISVDTMTRKANWNSDCRSPYTTPTQSMFVVSNPSDTCIDAGP